MRTNKKILLTISMGVLIGGSLMAQTSDQQDEKKSSWIESNHKAYIDQGGQTDPIRTIRVKDEKVSGYNIKAIDKSQAEPKREKVTILFPNDPTFPKYVNTGNKQSDDDNYRKSKDQWIQNNSVKYSKLTIKEKNSEAPSVIRARELNSNIHENSKK